MWVGVGYPGLLLEIEDFLSPFLPFHLLILGLHDPISGLTTEGRRFITQKLNGRYHDGEDIF